MTGRVYVKQGDGYTVEDGERLCLDHGHEIPDTVRASFGRFGGALTATCSACSFVCGYWECACEWEHDCAEWRKVPANIVGGWFS